MELDPDRCYRALRARDVRFDGRFFVGVTSTGIYCRPICPSRPPKRENCTFHLSAAAAEAAGFRPCLRCRPELAPGHASIDAGARLAQQAASLIEDGVVNGGSIDAIAARLGISDRHLRRVFQSEFGVAPIAYAQTHRLLLAKRLLTDTRLSVTDVALASGFQSLRRFNALFRERYRLKPTDLRRTVAARDISDRFTFELAFRPPLDWRALIDFFAARTIAGVDDVSGDAYRRTLRISVRGAEHMGWIEVRPVACKHTVQVAVAASFANVLPAVLARTKRVFDLACDPGQVQAALGDLAAANPGLRLPGAFDAFELAVRAVLGQQITVRAARTLAGRFAERFGTPIDTPFDGLTRLFPAPATVATLPYGDIAALGIIATRAKTILALAQGFASGTVVLEPGGDADASIERLRALPGIGDWTAQYMAMRALAWPDAFPHTDYGVMKALGEKNPRCVLAMAEAWRPWRAYAVMHLWQSLK
jgi:AraC family transcriptional regulator, regulatory protein of adaptative response / DNA-3-methyladenine glycosylase II